MLVFNRSNRDYFKSGHGVLQVLPGVIGKSASLLFSKLLQLGKNAARSKSEEVIKQASAKLVDKAAEKVRPIIRKSIPKKLNPKAEEILRKYASAGEQQLNKISKNILDKYLVGSGIVLD